ncbi:MAG: SDR family NAD(P)-dependent oxidoreductase [Clostridia bacterium]|nr:SDR family NAD(P)-dependent oxidoreductase [Clostridia bacterium]MBR5422499.1 SDR family NAD(P)-dependent oxidoreductase [Clostridia bacterium]
MKYVLFTGATGDLGRCCIEEIVKLGGYTVFAGGTNAAKLASLGEIENVIPLPLDVTSEESIEAAYNTVRGYTYRLDAVVNFAGIHTFTSMVEGDCVHEIEKMLNVNVMGMVRVNKRFFEMVRIGHGRIINCSSESGWMTPQPFNGPYTMTKYAVEAYNDSLRRELMYLDIPVIKLQPGSFKTQLTDKIYRDFDRAIETTNYFKKILTTMKPMMTMELGLDHDPKKLARKLILALTAKLPRIKYKVCTGKLLMTLELLPDKAVDLAYKAIVH